MVGLLLLTKFSPIPALLTVLVVSLQVALGESLLGRFSGFNQISRLAKVGLGFCIGATVSTFFYVFVVTFTSAMVAIISQIILFVLASLLRWTQISSTNVQATSEELGAVKWLAVVALLGLSPNWFWPVPVAIWMTILFLAWPRFKKCFTSVKVILALIFGASGSSPVHGVQRFSRADRWAQSKESARAAVYSGRPRQRTPAHARRVLLHMARR